MKEFYLHIAGRAIPGIRTPVPGVPLYHLLNGYLFTSGTSTFNSEHEMLDEVRDWARSLGWDDAARIEWIEPEGVL